MKMRKIISPHLDQLLPRSTALPSSPSPKAEDPPECTHSRLSRPTPFDTSIQTQNAFTTPQICITSVSHFPASHPEFSSSVGLLAALGEDRHSDRDLSQRLLRRLHQQHLQHAALVDVGVEAGLPGWVHGGLPLDQGLPPLWRGRGEE